MIIIEEKKSGLIKHVKFGTSFTLHLVPQQHTPLKGLRIM